MEFNQYNTTVQQWIHTVLENRETNADVVLECCRDIIAYGRETDDPKLMGFGFFYGGEIYYELNDGAHFFHMMTEALTYLGPCRGMGTCGALLQFSGNRIHEQRKSIACA